MVRQKSSHSEESKCIAKKPPEEDTGNPLGERFNPSPFSCQAGSWQSMPVYRAVIRTRVIGRNRRRVSGSWWQLT
jgi:hypothetical protein